MVKVQQMYPALSLVAHYSHSSHIPSSCQVPCSSPHPVLAAGTMFCPLPLSLWMVKVQQMYPALSLVAHYSHSSHIPSSCQVPCSSPHPVLAAGTMFCPLP